MIQTFGSWKQAHRHYVLNSDAYEHSVIVPRLAYAGYTATECNNRDKAMFRQGWPNSLEPGYSLTEYLFSYCWLRDTQVQ